LQAIAEGKHCAIVTNVETLQKLGGGLKAGAKQRFYDKGD
jgi:hypothetical protein